MITIKKDRSVASLVCGLIGFVSFIFMIPTYGFISPITIALGVAGIVLGRKSLKITKSTAAVAGIVVSIITLSLMVFIIIIMIILVFLANL